MLLLNLTAHWQLSYPGGWDLIFISLVSVYAGISQLETDNIAYWRVQFIFFSLFHHLLIFLFLRSAFFVLQQIFILSLKESIDVWQLSVVAIWHYYRSLTLLSFTRLCSKHFSRWLLWKAPLYHNATDGKCRTIYSAIWHAVFIEMRIWVETEMSFANIGSWGHYFVERSISGQFLGPVKANKVLEEKNNQVLRCHQSSH